MPKQVLFPRRRLRTPSATERTVGLILIVVLGVMIGLFVLSGRRPGPAGVPETASPGLAGSLPGEGLPLTTPSGWPRGEPERYDADALFEKINGKADAYVLYRFEHLLFATYTRPTNPEVYLDLYVYVMGSPLDAFGTYRGQRSGREEALEVGDEAAVSRGAVFLRRGAHYVEVVASGPEAQDEAIALARVLGRATVATPDPATQVPSFPARGLVIVRFDREGAVGVGALRDAFIAIYDDDTQIVRARQDSVQSAQAAATRAAEDKAFLGEPATFVARGLEVIGVVGKTDEAERRVLIEKVLATLEGEE